MKQEIDNMAAEIDDCPLGYTINIAASKWKPEILYLLYMNKVLRYGNLKRKLKGITHKVLSEKLKSLEKDGMISRTEYSTVPLTVEYRLSSRGESVLPILKSMYIWGKNIENSEDIGSN